MPSRDRLLFMAGVVGLFFSLAAFTAVIPDEKLGRQTDKVTVEVHYPVLGQQQIDEDIADWAKQLADNFESTYTEEPKLTNSLYELKATYTITRPSDAALTVAWEVSSYTGGAHGNLDIITNTYDVKTGKTVDLYDLFKDLDTALNEMSSYSYKKLAENTEDMSNEDMLRGGTTPDADNFSSFALTPAGIRIFFQPYQVAPWAAGKQIVDIPLEEIMEAGPRLELWGKTAFQESAPAGGATSLSE